MIERLDLAALAPAKRAEVIYAQARSDLTGRLWRAALGDDDGGEQSAPDRTGCAGPRCTSSRGPDLGGLLGLLDVGVQQPRPPAVDSQAVLSTGSAVPVDARGLGANAHLAPALERAAARAGLPSAALAAIVDAEAGRGRDGAWNAYSRNPRSSAAGLGQFLSGTWIGEAQRPGTWLHTRAAAEGWLENGRVAACHRPKLLNLRYSAEASIEATADYARANLDGLRRRGIAVGDEPGAIARAAYLGHHLGIGDALSFLGRGLEGGRARQLLAAQVGAASAATRISQAGDARGAHRAWLQGYLDARIRPERFQL